MTYPNIHLRRLRYNKILRGLVQETVLRAEDCVLPLFICHGERSIDLKSMPGHKQLCLNDLPAEIAEIQQLGIKSVLLFGIPSHKDGTGSNSYDDNGIIQQAVRLIKSIAPDLFIITDVCFCEYTDHGHCGVLNECHDVDNDKTLPYLAKQAVSHARAGADMVAPSGMIDGMVKAIRTALDENNFHRIPVLSYAVKYASAFYGPFREAAECAPQFGDRQTYQMNPANVAEGLREAEIDIAEGADIIMVKPALPYLDVIAKLKMRFPEIPLCAYQVSGEYSMIKAAAANGWIDERKITLESLLAIKRAGANFIFTYFAKDVAKWLKAEESKSIY